MTSKRLDLGGWRSGIEHNPFSSDRLALELSFFNPLKENIEKKEKDFSRLFSKHRLKGASLLAAKIFHLASSRFFLVFSGRWKEGNSDEVNFLQSLFFYAKILVLKNKKLGTRKKKSFERFFSREMTELSLRAWPADGRGEASGMELKSRCEKSAEAFCSALSGKGKNGKNL